MAKARPLLDRLLNAPDLTKIVPHLQPEVLHRVIQICGLEDCAEFVALATPDQLARVLDVDIWRSRPGGPLGEVGDVFDDERFGLWLEVLMESGAHVAAQKLVGLDIELVIAGFARHVAVFEGAAVSSYATLDGEQVPGRVSSGRPVCEIGGYVIEARRASAWDAIVDLLAFLDSEHVDYFRRLMRGCVRLSNGTREADGFHNLLQDREQDLFDLGSDREERREKQGYVTPPQARAFLQTARHVDLAGDRPPTSPLARAYFRAIETAPETDGAPSPEPGGPLPESSADFPPIETGGIEGVFEVLREAGVLTPQPRALIAAGDGEASRLRLIQAYVGSHPSSAAELAYLANTIMAGCSIQDRGFTPREASDAAAAICNLGLDNWPERWGEPDLVSAFQVGWTILDRDVCLFVTERLIDIISGFRCGDRDIQLRMHSLRIQLVRHVRDRAPWRGRGALDVIVMLDAPAWAALQALIDECPVMHAALRASRGSSLRIDPTDFTFISDNSQIATIRAFVASLPSLLTR